MVTATGVARVGNNATLALVFAIGPVAIIGSLRVVSRLAPEVAPAKLQLCRIFLVAAFTLFTVMIVIQQMVLLQFREMQAATEDPAAAETLRLVFNGVNLVQLGIDVAFDVFYCLGVVQLGGAMYRHPQFGRVLGGFGMASAGALLALNIAAFPHVPSEIGFVDLGPVTGVWWLVVIAHLLRLRWRQAPGLTAA